MNKKILILSFVVVIAMSLTSCKFLNKKDDIVKTDKTIKVEKENQEDNLPSSEMIEGLEGPQIDSKSDMAIMITGEVSGNKYVIDNSSIRSFGGESNTYIGDNGNQSYQLQVEEPIKINKVTEELGELETNIRYKDINFDLYTETLNMAEVNPKGSATIYSRGGYSRVLLIDSENSINYTSEDSTKLGIDKVSLGYLLSGDLENCIIGINGYNYNLSTDADSILLKKNENGEFEAFRNNSETLKSNNNGEYASGSEQPLSTYTIKINLNKI